MKPGMLLRRALDALRPPAGNRSYTCEILTLTENSRQRALAPLDRHGRPGPA